MKEPISCQAGIVPKGRKKASHFLEYYHTPLLYKTKSFHNPRNMGPQLLNFSLGTQIAEQKDKKHGLEGFTYHSVAQELLEREDSIIDVGWIAS